jgi:hypothetical protein
MTWKSISRDSSGKDTGSIYVLPRTPEGLVKIGFRGIKVIDIHSISQALLIMLFLVDQLSASTPGCFFRTRWPVVGTSASGRVYSHTRPCFSRSEAVRVYIYA